MEQIKEKMNLPNGIVVFRFIDEYCDINPPKEKLNF